MGFVNCATGLSDIPFVRPVRTYQNRVIKTTQVLPPIPLRDWDWCATFEDYDGEDYVGWGKSEEDAIQDLCNQASAEGDASE